MSTSTKKIAVMGMLLAAQVVAGMFFSIKLPLVTIGFIFLPLSLTSILCGPLWGAAAGVMGDFLIASLGPYGYYPPMATTAFLSGLIYGLFLYRKPITLWRVTLCVVTECLLCSVLLQTYWITLLSGQGYLYLLWIRLGQNLLVAPVSVVCIRIVAPRVLDLGTRILGAPAVSAVQK